MHHLIALWGPTKRTNNSFLAHSIVANRDLQNLPIWGTSERQGALSWTPLWRTIAMTCSELIRSYLQVCYPTATCTEPANISVLAPRIATNKVCESHLSRRRISDTHFGASFRLAISQRWREPSRWYFQRLENFNSTI